jgi:hypothetical protein
MNKKKVKKQPLSEASGRVHKERELPYDLVRFSFRLFTVSSKFCLPTEDDQKPEYLSRLLERLRDVSNYTVSRFRSEKHHGLRAHLHDWASTSEPNGYQHLTEQLKQCEPWQFCLTANEHGRVHGILIDEVFYVVWLDHSHALYPND